MKKITKSLFLTAVMTMTCSVNALEWGWSEINIGDTTLENKGMAWAATAIATISGTLFYKNAEFLQRKTLEWVQQNVPYIPVINPEPEKYVFPFQSKATLNEIAQHAQPNETVWAKIQGDKAQKQGYKTIVLTGPKGTGKSTEAAVITAHTENAKGLYTISQSGLAEYCKRTQQNQVSVLNTIYKNIFVTLEPGQVAIIHEEEGGNELIVDSNNPEQQKAILERRNFMETAKKQYPNIIPIISTNVGQSSSENNEQNGGFDAPSQDRMHVIHIGNPNAKQRVDFVNNVRYNIEENDTDFAHGVIREQGLPQPTIKDYLFSYLPTMFNKKHLEQKSAQAQAVRNQHFNEQYHTTEAMHDAAQEKHKNQIKQLTTDMENLQKPWSLYCLFNKSYNEVRKLRNAEAQQIQNQIDTLQSYGYVTPIVTTKLDAKTDMTHDEKKELIDSTTTKANGTQSSKRDLQNLLIAQTAQAARERIERLNRVATKSKTVTITPGQASQEYAELNGFTQPTNPSLFAIQEQNRQIAASTSTGAAAQIYNTPIEYQKPFYTIDKANRTSTYHAQNYDGSAIIVENKPYGQITIKDLQKTADGKDKDWHRFAEKAKLLAIKNERASGTSLQDQTFKANYKKGFAKAITDKRSSQLQRKAE